MAQLPFNGKKRFISSKKLNKLSMRWVVVVNATGEKLSVYEKSSESKWSKQVAYYFIHLNE